ncbi:ABC transporter permease [Agrobacterium genomosp. 13]|uniref:Oligopeptide transport system permease protein OppB n=1 Tax=Agrobacterium genomosp. 13 str. CFBP 6927 TaxID=1183428 RepID=A0ABM9VBW5_9HYPH|nr:ABC transporter permease [Agrobacterium genomosp. 13]CUX14045.1 Oligopeptide transport system permease protein OppB [Agrobacterium genomosp. 13 str. CFBP 6927]
MQLFSFGMRSALAMLALSLASFTLIALMPADPVQIAIRVWNMTATSETVAALREEWGLDRPLLLRYLHWLADFVIGDWGRSFRTGEPVFAEFSERLPVSLMLGLAGMLLAIAVAVPIGFFAAARLGGVTDRASRAFSVFVQAVPGFWLGLILLWVLGVQLRWIRPFATDATAIVLPVMLIASHSTAVFARVYRRDMMETMRQPYFRTALAKGLSRRQALWRHAHRSAFYALLSAVRSEAGWVIGSTATMEILFNLPGLSQFLVQSIAVRDQMVLQAYVMVIALWLLLMNLIVHILQRFLDPRLGR